MSNRRYICAVITIVRPDWSSGYWRFTQFCRQTLYTDHLCSTSVAQAYHKPSAHILKRRVGRGNSQRSCHLRNKDTENKAFRKIHTGNHRTRQGGEKGTGALHMGCLGAVTRFERWMFCKVTSRVTDMHRVYKAHVVHEISLLVALWMLLTIFNHFTHTHRRLQYYTSGLFCFRKSKTQCVRHDSEWIKSTCKLFSSQEVHHLLCFF